MTQPSGWYDDPQDPNSLRYFDGVLWTDHVEPKQRIQPGIGRPADHDTSPTAAGASSYANPGHTPSDPPSHYGYAAAPRGSWSHSGPTTPDGSPLAEWWQRLVAALVDELILSFLAAILGGYWVYQFIERYAVLVAELAAADVDRLDPLLDRWINESMQLILPVLTIQAIIHVIYHVYFLTRSGATPGKMIMGIRVRRVDRPGPLTLVEALRRLAIHIGAFVLGFVPLISIVAGVASILDPLWLLWDPRRQTLHDKLADTLVEKRPKG